MLYVNDKEINYDLFPNNEIKLPPVDLGINLKAGKIASINVKLIYQYSIDIVNLIFVKQYLDDKYPSLKKTLTMKYIPYERMDRQTENQMCTCKYFCTLINQLNFDKVEILDAHSNVALAVLNKVKQLSIVPYIQHIISIENIDGIFLPDVGAYKKYTEVLSDINIPKFWGNKHRDLDNGKITSYDIIGDMNLKNKNILIVDDICVKGFTTLFASTELKNRGANKVIFYCSHCEDAIHSGQLLKSNMVDKIYTTDSLRFDEDNKINVFE